MWKSATIYSSIDQNYKILINYVIQKIIYAFDQQHTCPCTLTHLCRMYFPIPINWTSPFPILELLGGIFHFYSNF